MRLPPFDQVVRKYGPAVLRVCRSSLPRADADDAWSATFLAALRAYPQLAPTASIEAWLVTIAHRKVIDLVRARERRPAPMADPPEPHGRFGDEPQEPDEALWDAVRTLPEKQRLCVAYRYVADLSYRQIAEIVGGSEAAARRAAADGVRTLRYNYDKEPDRA
ncbi:RNA polymerase sigma factor [Blastococcus sp. Marseille-P5729]|uniref:RNA polymerase sigma factor n=1 Tax=Blastococcus sp. Marseille-P5729 TaxID=2086582 RepID=UPI000D0F0F04|nr:sigma-70 family RNA polymerase sigma factor [Blastococcus sp. Marseille-P5729]